MAKRGWSHRWWLSVGTALLAVLGLGACDGGGATPTEVQMQEEGLGAAVEPTAHPPGHYEICPDTLLVDVGGNPVMFTVSELPSVSCSTRIQNNRNTMTVDGTLPESMIPPRNERMTFESSGYYCAVPFLQPGGAYEPVPTDDWSMRLTARGDLVGRCVLHVE